MRRRIPLLHKTSSVQVTEAMGNKLAQNHPLDICIHNTWLGRELDRRLPVPMLGSGFGQDILWPSDGGTMRLCLMRIFLSN